MSAVLTGVMSNYQMNLPKSQAINITFENIGYSVPDGKKGRRQILQCISGEFRSGELTAIMGPSGSGKSSFLNILSGFRTKRMQGCIYRNGINVTEKNGNIKKDTCYILQDDQLCPLFTVMETMMTAAQLKLGINSSEKAKIIMIDDILESLGLLSTKNTRCQQLSGGQKKRLSVALELLSNPSIMFLDEPTTGLDSSSSAQCIRILKALARAGRTIVCTIHQPSASIFELFDHVYVISEGSCIYQGSSTNLVPYLSHVGVPCPQYHSVADFVSEVAAGDHGDCSRRLAQAAMDSRWRCPPVIPAKSEDHRMRKAVSTTPPSEFTKVWILINRNLIQLYRDWTVTHLKLVAHALIGTIFGLNFQNFGNDGSKAISNVAFMFCVIMYLSYTAMMPAVLRFPEELSIVKKEKFNNWYNLKTYYVAYLTANTPVQLMSVAVFVSISYYLTGQPMEFRRFAMFLTICWLTYLVAESLGLYLGTFKNILHSLFFGSLAIAYLLVYSGCLALFPHMSTYLYALSFFSFGRWAFDGLVLSVYGYGRETIDCPIEVEYCHLRSPTRILSEMGVIDGNYWMDLLILLGILLFLRTLAFVALKRKVTCK